MMTLATPTGTLWARLMRLGVGKVVNTEMKELLMCYRYAVEERVWVVTRSKLVQDGHKKNHYRLTLF